MVALTDGGYELGPPPAVVASVPEPTGATLLLLGILALLPKTAKPLSRRKGLAPLADLRTHTGRPRHRRPGPAVSKSEIAVFKQRRRLANTRHGWPSDRQISFRHAIA